MTVEQLAPLIDRLAKKPTRVLLIAIEVAPERRNYPLVSFRIFDPKSEKRFELPCLGQRRSEKPK
jgi:hypothetical protein